LIARPGAYRSRYHQRVSPTSITRRIASFYNTELLGNADHVLIPARSLVTARYFAPSKYYCTPRNAADRRNNRQSESLGVMPRAVPASANAPSKNIADDLCRRAADAGIAREEPISRTQLFCFHLLIRQYRARRYTAASISICHARRARRGLDGADGLQERAEWCFDAAMSVRCHSQYWRHPY